MAGPATLGLALASGLRWSAPAECPSATEVRARVRALVATGARLRDDLSVTAQVQAQGERWVLELSVRTSERASRRTMSTDDCETLGDAVALIVATFVSPAELPERVDAQPRPTDPPERRPVRVAILPGADDPVPRPSAPAELGPDPSGAIRRPEPAASARRSRTSRGGQIEGGVSLGRATQTDLDLGPEVAASWRRGLAWVSVGALGLLPRRTPVPTREGVRLQRWMIAGRVKLGVVMPLARFLEVPVGLGAELGPVVARGVGIDRPRTVVSPWLAAIGFVRVMGYPSPRWGLWAEVDGLLGVLLPRFTVDGAEPMGSAPIGIRASVGVQWRWGPRSSG